MSKNFFETKAVKDFIICGSYKVLCGDQLSVLSATSSILNVDRKVNSVKHSLVINPCFFSDRRKPLLFQQDTIEKLINHIKITNK